MKEGINKRLVGVFMLMLTLVLLTGCGIKAQTSGDAIQYEGKEYAAIEYPANVFRYAYNGNSHYDIEEVEGIYPIDSPNWDMVWDDGTLYCDKKYAAKANAFYADDENYVWYLLIDYDVEDKEGYSVDIELTADELEYVYNIENKEKNLAVFFDELDKTASIFKISNDGVVRGTLLIGKYKREWYWRSGIMDESRESDGTCPEYIQPLPESLSDKICLEE
ncbi:MAG: hypothetical protein IKJ77_04515 [Firmicutes bacterium]|nr:hypothetical protein [Bacillota bacterium]